MQRLIAFAQFLLLLMLTSLYVYPASEMVFISLIHEPLARDENQIIFASLIFTALSMYWLTRYLGWSRSIASGLAIAWAFCPFTRARAHAGGTLEGVGTFYLPLIFLALGLITRGGGWRSLILAALCFSSLLMAAADFQVTSFLLTPLFIIFLLSQPEFRLRPRLILGRSIVALLPTILGLICLFPVMRPAKSTEILARPMDYLAGDISINSGSADSNFLRQKINEAIVEELPPGQAKERSNGIRWSLLILSLAAVIFLLKGRFREDPSTKAGLRFFIVFALVAFCLSALSLPLFSELRVASRAGINVHFAVLMITGHFLAAKIRWRRFVHIPGVFPALMVAGYPPRMQNIPPRPPGVAAVKLWTETPHSNSEAPTR